jgi:hypothetical protein
MADICLVFDAWGVSIFIQFHNDVTSYRILFTETGNSIEQREKMVELEGFEKLCLNHTSYISSLITH